MIRLLFITLLAVGAANAATVKVQRLITVGDTAAGVTVTDLRQVSQNERGEIAVAGNAASINNTIWAGFPGFMRIITRNGLPAPDGGVFTNVSGSTLIVPVINDAGDVAFLANENTTGMYTSVGGVIGKVARHGDAVPGIPGATFAMTFGAVTRPFFGSTNQFQFLTRMDGSTNGADNMALWGGIAGMPQMIARESGAIPGQPGLFFHSTNFIFEEVTANTLGQTALCTTLSGAGVVANVNDDGVLLGGAGGFSFVVRGGDPAAAFGLPPDATFAAVGDGWPVRINDFGEVLFFSELRGTGVSGTLNTGNHTSLWKGPPGALRMIARRGDAAPGLPGVTLLLATSLIPELEHIAYAGNGDAAFISTLAGAVTTGTDTAFFANIAEVNHLIAREGAQAPGLPAGVVFNNIATAQGWRFAINSSGQLAIHADLTGTGVTNANDAALYFWTVADGLMLVAREGSSVETAPGVFQIITNIVPNGTHGDDSGSPRNFNSRGQLTFTAELDGSPAVVRATIVTPASYTLLTASLHASAGGASASTHYAADTEMNASGVMGISAANVIKPGFTGQLYDPAALTLAATPASVAENAATQLTTTVAMDDDTILPLAAGVSQWSIVAGPLMSIHPSTHQALVGTVFQNASATARASFAGLSSTLVIPVLNTNTDDLAQYSGDGIADDWQVQYFGLPPNLNAAPGSNPDFDGQDNLFEFLAGTNPLNAASHFITLPSFVAPGTFGVTINQAVPGTLYTVLKSPDLGALASWTEVTSFTVVSPQINVLVEDPNPPPGKGFYKVTLEKE